MGDRGRGGPPPLLLLRRGGGPGGSGAASSGSAAASVAAPRPVNLPSIETIPDPTEEQIYSLLQRNVSQQDLIYGSAMAYEPRAFSPERRLFAP